MFKQISGNKVVPSKLVSVSEVSDTKSHQVFLTSSPRNIDQIQQCYLLPPLPFFPSCLFSNECENRTKSFDSFGRRREEQRVLPISCKRTATRQPDGQKVSGTRPRLLSGAFPSAGADSRAGLTWDSWRFLQPPFRLNCCTNEAIFLKAAPDWASLSGPTAGNHTEK